MAQTVKQYLPEYNLGGDILAGGAGIIGGALGTIPGIGGALQQGVYGLHGAIDKDLSPSERAARGFGQAAGGVATGAITGNVGGAIRQGVGGLQQGLNVTEGFNGNVQTVADPLLGMAGQASNYLLCGGKVPRLQNGGTTPAYGVEGVPEYYNPTYKKQIGKAGHTYQLPPGKQVDWIPYKEPEEPIPSVREIRRDMLPKKRYNPYWSTYPTRGQRAIDAGILEYGGNVSYEHGGPVYEAERGEVVDGGMPTAYEGGGVTPNSATSARITGNTHAQGGVQMSGGERVFSDKLYVSKDLLKDLEL